MEHLVVRFTYFINHYDFFKYALSIIFGASISGIVSYFVSSKREKNKLKIDLKVKSAEIILIDIRDLLIKLARLIINLKNLKKAILEFYEYQINKDDLHTNYSNSLLEYNDKKEQYADSFTKYYNTFITRLIILSEFKEFHINIIDLDDQITKSNGKIADIIEDLIARNVQENSNKLTTEDIENINTVFDIINKQAENYYTIISELTLLIQNTIFGDLFKKIKI